MNKSIIAQARWWKGVKVDHSKILNVIVGGMAFAAFVLWIVRVQTKKRLSAKTKTEATKEL